MSEEQELNWDEEIRSRTKYSTFEQLYKDDYNCIKAKVRSCLANYPGSVDDLVSIIFLRIMDNIQLFHPQTNFKAWALTISANTCINFVKREGKYVLTEDFPQNGGGYDLEEKMIDFISAESLIDYLETRIPVNFFQPMMMASCGYSCPDISKKLKIPVGTVMSRIYRGRQIAKNLLVQRNLGTVILGDNLPEMG